jgi:hypothetical protein
MWASKFIPKLFKWLVFDKHRKEEPRFCGGTWEKDVESLRGPGRRRAGSGLDGETTMPAPTRDDQRALDPSPLDHRASSEGRSDCRFARRRRRTLVALRHTRRQSHIAPSAGTPTALPSFAATNGRMLLWSCR